MKLRPQSIFQRLTISGILALAGIIGPAVLSLTDAIAVFSYPQYNAIRDSISSIALTPMGWLQTIGFLVIGLLMEVFAVGLYFGIRKRRGFGVSIAVFVFFGFGLLLLGAFRTDPLGTPPTIQGTIHSITAQTIFMLFPIACFLLAPSLRADPRWKAFFVYTIVTGIIACFLVIMQVRLPAQLSWFGLYERIIVANVIIWMEVVAIRLLRLSLRQR